MDPVTNKAISELTTLLREKVITLAEWRQEVLALRAPPPPRDMGGMDEKHNDEPPAARASHKLSDADFDEVMGDLLADDEELEHKDAPEEHEEEELEHKDEHEEHKEGPTRFFHAEFVIQLFAQRADGTLRPGERRTIRG